MGVQLTQATANPEVSTSYAVKNGFIRLLEVQRIPLV